MRGRKSTCLLQKPTETADGGGGQTVVWNDVIEFKGVLSPISRREQIAYERETVFADYRLFFDYSAITEHNRSEVKEKNRTKIGTRLFNIKAVANYDDLHYELELLETK